jgi:hypothetical protein
MPESDWTKGLWAIFHKFPHLLTAIGVVLCVFAVAGGWPGKFPILQPDRLPLEIGGITLVVIGVLLYVWEAWQKRRDERKPVPAVVSDTVPDAALFKAQIDYPAQNALVDDTVDAGGTVPKAPPGYEWRVLRGYPKRGGFIPHGYFDLDAITGKWRVVGFQVAGEPGRKPNDQRSLEIWLVGADGRALLKCWSDAHSVHRLAMDKLDQAGISGGWLDPITDKTKDMVRCGKVDLLRR